MVDIVKKLKELLLSGDIKKKALIVGLIASLGFNGLFIATISYDIGLEEQMQLEIDELTEDNATLKRQKGTLENQNKDLKEKVEKAQPWFDMSEEEQLKLEEEQRKLEEERIAKEKAEQEEKERLEEEQRQKEEQERLAKEQEEQRIREQEQQRQNQLEEVNATVEYTIKQGMGSGYSVDVEVNGNQVNVNIIGHDLDVSGISRSQLDILIEQYNIDGTQNQLAQDVKNIYTQLGYNMTVKLTTYSSNGTLIYSTQR